ncbi:hypothetical protein FGIG_02960 [Fasciola gigantica]|uniref:BZIP domain-containing protein n=1 Tax=Fasciola gigantica TaxID=46835 RepID=A0A504Y3G9_FASGI|nr:hypothetical protein FGIG_02960 [Fasciola gigantica]
MHCSGLKKPNESSVAYRDLRERNNVAVRKSREKSRAAKLAMIERHNQLSLANVQLKEAMRKRLRELKVLRYLLVRSRKTLPVSLLDLFAACQIGGPLQALLVDCDTGSDQSVSDGFARCLEVQLGGTPEFN